uniref:Group 3 allergen SMIPP-S YvT004A06 n=2 Tax=Sarcoptes scabiei TaxID=52283 RepID=Q6VPT2_SARSC|nr:group 3 allergen SMIPP-S YvT004A06 [Sarcoptes scabiei]
MSCLLSSFSLVMLVVFAVLEPNPSTAIIGGKKSDITKEPWAVGVLVDEKPFCGGSILTANFVITAAQCVDGTKPSDISIHYGSSYRTTKGTSVMAKKIYIVRYHPLTMQNNYAVIETEMPIKLDDKTTKKIELPSLLYDPEPDTSVLVSGWGSTNFKSLEYSGDLMEANFTVVDRKSCEEQYKQIEADKYIYDGVFCAGGEYDETYIGYGDAGDPAVQNGTLVGVASYISSMPSEFPSVFLRVGYYVLDIKDIISGKVKPQEY